MDWDIIERLAPHLAWPLVALICLPILIWKFDTIAKTIADLKNLSENVSDLTNIPAVVREAAKDISTIKVDLIEIKQTQQIQDIEKSAEGNVEDVVVANVNAEPSPHEDPRVCLSQREQMDRVRRAWRTVVEALERACARARITDLDRRSPGQAARRLADQRRSSPLRFEDAEKVAELHGTYKAYVRLQNSRNNQITSDRAEEFEILAAEAVRILDSFGQTDIFD